MQLHICRYFDFLQNLEGIKEFLQLRKKSFLSLPDLTKVSQSKLKNLKKKAWKLRQKQKNAGKQGNNKGKKGKGKGKNNKNK